MGIDGVNHQMAGLQGQRQESKVIISITIRCLILDTGYSIIHNPVSVSGIQYPATRIDYLIDASSS